MKSLLSLFVIASAVAVPAAANDTPEKTSIALRASTLGVGVELAQVLPIANLSARVAFNTYDHDMNETIEGIPYDLVFGLRSTMAMLDWRPLGKTMHFTGGLVFNGNKISASSQTAGTYTVGGTNFAAADVGNLNASVTFDSVVPYAGLGWNVSLGSKTAVNLELGVVLQGAPELTLEADGPLASDPTFQSELANEAAEFQKDMEDYEFYPVVGLSLARRF